MTKKLTKIRLVLILFQLRYMCVVAKECKKWSNTIDYRALSTHPTLGPRATTLTALNLSLLHPLYVEVVNAIATTDCIFTAVEKNNPKIIKKTTFMECR